MFRRILCKIMQISTPFLTLLSNWLLYVGFAKARALRRFILRGAGISFEGDFFADSGFRLIQGQNLKFGKNVSLGHDNHFWCFNKIYVGAFTQTAKDLLLISGSHRLGNFEAISGAEQEIRVGPGCWVGARVTILGGSIIGKGCIIAAGAVVKGSYPDFSIIGGVPAKVIGQRNPDDVIVGAFGNYSLSELKSDDA